MNIEIHLIQNFAPSNLNRDDTNNPKDTEFGGVRRARISSQCIKRAIRQEPVFARTTAVDNGTRTRKLKGKISGALINAGKPAEKASDFAEAIVTQYSKMDKDAERTSVLLYISKAEMDGLTAQILENWDAIDAEIKDKKSPVAVNIAKEFFKNLKGRTSAPDIALFGRMMAEKPDLNIDAACQVAHAISTHAVSMDMDFFTAVDDIKDEENMGAGMMGMGGFNSSCFYRYACIDFDQLVNNLDGDVALARKTVEAFMRSSAQAVPTGKQNSHAAQNPPSLVMSVVREGGAWSLANAFEKPVYAGERSLIEASVQALDAYWGKLTGFYGEPGIAVAAAMDGAEFIKNLKDSQVDSLNNWVQETIALLPQD